MKQACRSRKNLASLIMASQVELYQQYVLNKALPLPEKVVEAFYKNPRHIFIPEYSIAEAYSDQALPLYEKGPYSATISQPSFVLTILDRLNLEEGQKVFELGTGSGWNTAMMATIVGDQGKIISAEIIPEMAERAQKVLQGLDYMNVMVLNQDGFEGYPAEAPFDRIIFTAGSSEFPELLFSQLKEQGRMIFVRHSYLGHDDLEVIVKKEGKPRVIESIPCNFVSVVRKKESRLDSGTL